ncbi:hypothetical protein MUK42_24675 [Musa troglodytarum]|uniref:Uncharacterized protein n=1 Tax=Musa troglodytarum TaxID=320322 RepID=A0A9E7KCY3_9LILI|nr:hypothetical protein MUK42_24675 [Musa troglodytarum]
MASAAAVGGRQSRSFAKRETKGGGKGEMSCPTCNVEIREEQVRSRGFACRDRRGAEEEEEERTSTSAGEAHTVRGELGRALHMVGRGRGAASNIGHGVIGLHR